MVADPKLKVPSATKEDVFAASLLADLARVDRYDAIQKMIPMVTAARLWAEAQLDQQEKTDGDHRHDQA